MKLRLRGPSGASTIEVQPETTTAELEALVFSSTNIEPEFQELRSGFPPKPLDVASSTTVGTLGLSNGDSLTVSRRDVSRTSAGPSPSQATSTTPSLPPQVPGPVPGFATTAATISREPVTSSVNVPPFTTRSVPANASRRETDGGGKSPEGTYIAYDGGYLVLRVVPDDNSCLFNAVGLVLDRGGSNIATRLRSVVADTIRSNPIEWSEPFLGRQPEDYVRTITKKDTWGGAIELAILSEHYRTEICSIDVQSGRIDRFGEGKGYNQRVVVVYSGIHYDAVSQSYISPTDAPPSQSFPPDLSFDTTVFTTESDGILLASQELVAQLRKKRYFTDTANFDLRCNSCGEGLKGEKGAREHAMKTGHTSFGEWEAAAA